MKRLVLVLLAVPTLSFAQSEPDSAELDPTSGRRIIYQKATQIDFDGIDVDAALTRPSLTLVEERRATEFGSLFKLREDFNPEMDQSIAQVK